jgi:hypothetical protein
MELVLSVMSFIFFLYGMFMLVEVVAYFASKTVNWIFKQFKAKAPVFTLVRT